MKVHPEISMKTKSRRKIANPELSTFGRDLPNCSDNSCEPPRIWRESGAIMSRIERGRVRSSFQRAGSQAVDFTFPRYDTNSCHQPPPGANAPPLLNQGGEPWPEPSRGAYIYKAMQMEATISMKIKGLIGNSMDWAKIVCY